MNSVKLFLIDKKYGIVIFIIIIAAFILKDRVNFTDVIVEEHNLVVKSNRMLDVFSDDNATKYNKKYRK